MLGRFLGSSIPTALNSHAAIDTETFVRTGQQQFGAVQNPVYLIRTLPEKLYKPTGEGAFGQWTGGLLGVLGKQMDDANTAAKQWAENR